MKDFRHRCLSLVLIMGACAILINFLSYDKYSGAEAAMRTIEKIPVNLGKWRGYDVPFEDLVYDILQTKSIIHRNYKAETGNVFLSLVYYPQTKVDFHSPEGCLAGQGINISKTQKKICINESKDLTIGVNQLIRQKENSEELIYYFYKAGGFIGPSYLKLRWALALNKFTKKEKSGSLIRVSTPLAKNDAEHAERRLKEFIYLLYPFLIRYL